MGKYTRGDERDELLADVAEMYYMGDLTQAEISRQIDMTRSAVSRMLTEARNKGIVEINVRRPLRFDAGLEAELQERFGLQAAHVLAGQRDGDYDKLRRQLGLAAAAVLKELLRPRMSCGVAWGTTVSAAITLTTASIQKAISSPITFYPSQPGESARAEIQQFPGTYNRCAVSLPMSAAFHYVVPVHHVGI